MTFIRTFGEFSTRSALTVTHNPFIPFMAFSPGMGLSGGQILALYTGFSKDTLTGPTASAGSMGAIFVDESVPTVTTDAVLARKALRSDVD